MSSDLLIRLARGGILIAVLVLGAACSDGGADTTTTTIAPSGGDTATPPESTTTTALMTTTTAAAAATTTTAAPPPAAAPAGASFDSWIAVLASLPVDEYDEAAARAFAAATDPAAEVLRSDDYASLSAGFWVVYLGEHDSQAEAEAACPPAITDCYSRYLAGVAPERGIGPATSTALALADFGELLVISTTTGEVLRSVHPSIGGEASFPGPITLDATGETAIYSIGFEDYWFDCEPSDGTLMQIDLSGGDPFQIGDGFSPSVSPDGTSLLYLAASACFPDPAEPQWVLAPIDTVVRRDLASGAEERITVDLTGDVADGYELWSAVWGPTGSVFVLDTRGGLWHHEATGDPDRWLGDGRLVTTLPEGQALVGYDPDAGHLLYVFSDFSDDDSVTFLRAVVVDDAEVVTVAEFPGAAAMALDRTGTHLLVASEGTLESDAGTVDLDTEVWQLAW